MVTELVSPVSENVYQCPVMRSTNTLNTVGKAVVTLKGAKEEMVISPKH